MSGIQDRAVVFRAYVVLATLGWFVVYFLLPGDISFRGDVFFLATLALTYALLKDRFGTAKKAGRGEMSP